MYASAVLHSFKKIRNIKEALVIISQENLFFTYLLIYLFIYLFFFCTWMMLFFDVIMLLMLFMLLYNDAITWMKVFFSSSRYELFDCYNMIYNYYNIVTILRII